MIWTNLPLALVPLLDLTILLLPAGDMRAACAFVLLWVLPGYAWGRALGGRWLSGLGLGFGVNILLTLLYHYLPGPVALAPALSIYSLAALLPLLLSSRQSPPQFPPKGGRMWLAYLLAIALCAALFRLPNLGYSELQGDEGTIIVRAAAALEGDDQELFLHQKGPLEILIPMATWRLSGEIDEFWLRLPFAWAGMLAALTAAVLARRWFGPVGGLTVGLLLAISGFHVAFSRIVQYQNFVVWLGLLALLELDRYRKLGERRDLLLGAGLLGLSALAHYDAVLILPAALLLAVRWGPGKAWRIRDLQVRDLLLAAAVGLVVMGLFYVPFGLNPNFGKTASYLAEGRVRGTLHFNGEKAWTMSTVYNSSYYVLVLLALVLASPWLGRRFPGFIYAGLAFLVPLVFYLFIVFDPRTHLYTFYAGAILLAGASGTGIAARLKKRGLWIAAGIGIITYLICAGYVWIMFVDHSPEYQRTWPEFKIPFYWTTYDEIPTYGRFGFPHRVGWQAVGHLIDEGVIQGTYASNEEQEITDVYTAQMPRTHCSRPDVYLVAERVQDRVQIDDGELKNDYALTGVVTTLGEPRLYWYTREMPSEVMTIDQAETRAWWSPEDIAPPTITGEYPLHLVFGETVELLGYDLDLTEAHPSGQIEVALYWRALEPLTRNNQVFVHLYDGQTQWAQHDGAPECAVMPTTRWEPGQIVPDPHLVDLPADMPPGPVPVLIGMYDLLTLNRLTVPGYVDNIVPLQEVEIRP